MSGITNAIGRYVQLTWQGRQLRGKCPFCSGTGDVNLIVTPARDNRAKQWDDHWPDRWMCLSCGQHDLGNTVEAFVRFAREAGLPESKPRKPGRERLPRPPRWKQIPAPKGSYPDMSPKWLGAPLAVQEERDGQGRRLGYRATYSRAGPMSWIFVRYAEHDPGIWKCRRPPLRQRIAALFPDVPGEVAKGIEGRERVSVTELLAGESASGYRAKAIAWALRGLGWTRRREGSGDRRWFYVPIS